MVDYRWISSFGKGFPLEDPEILLPWGKPIEEVARMSGGIQDNDRFCWQSVTYLQGLQYPLFSNNYVSATDPFHEISAYIGLTPTGWSDDASLKGFDEVSKHLVNLFGGPVERHIKNGVSEKNSSWKVGPLHFYLNVIDQFAFKCYLTIRDPEAYKAIPGR